MGVEPSLEKGRVVAGLVLSLCIQFQRHTMIKKVSGGYKVLSENGKKNLGGPYKTKKEAEKRLRQVEFFKRRKG
jgi:hypothetical protein